MTTPISMLALDLAKGSFQVCAIGMDGAVLYNRLLSRPRMAALLAEQPACVVAMEACATSHHWGRVALSHGHEVRLVPETYAKPFVKRRKNDKADAEAIAEAASRPTMRFVAVKSAETQGRAVAFRTHQCLVRQRTHRPGTTTEVHGRQVQVGAGQQDGADRHPPAADRRRIAPKARVPRDERYPPGGPQGRQFEPLAGRARGAQAQDGRGGGAGEQDGPHDLGHDNETGGLPNGVT